MRVYLIELKVEHQIIGLAGSGIKFPFWFGCVGDYDATTNKKASDACLSYLIKEFFNAIQPSFVCWGEE